MFCLFPKKIKCFNVISLLFFVVEFFSFFTHLSFAENNINYIQSINAILNGNLSEIYLKASKPLVSTIYELPNPERVVIDIADAVLASTFQKPSNFPFKLVISEIKGSNPIITRFEITVQDLVSFQSRQDGSDTIVSIASKNIIQSNNPIVIKSDSDQQKFAGIKVEKLEGKTVIHICSDTKIEHFTKKIVPKNKKINPQLVIAIDKIKLDDQFLGTQQVGTSIADVITSKTKLGVRVTLTSATDSIFPFVLSESADGLDISIDENNKEDQISKILLKKNTIENQLPEINPLDIKRSAKDHEQQMQDTFNFSGYNKDRITVEFQKMDLHNVFNFLRQVSGCNIVVDESVQGSLTLILDDVPWDFALDIILNLKGLEKEERFNTLVISPKGKGFIWPKQAQDNLSFKADAEVIEKEALVIQQQEKQSTETVEAKEIISKGKDAEKRENFETAVQYYEQAFEKWPENTHLANKLSSIYLVRLGQNIKAMYFAQRTLTIDPKNQLALLYAAIASANMQDTAQAEKFFFLGLQAKKPMKEAYLNYAAFKEKNKLYKEALQLLTQHDQLYGETLDSMIASARIYDKNGDRLQADKRYRAILTSGFQVPLDLKKFIQERIL